MPKQPPGTTNGKAWLIKLALAALLLVTSSPEITGQGYLTADPKPGDGVITLFRRYGLSTERCNIDHFRTINNIPGHIHLQTGRAYKLPLQVYTYDGRTIRSTIGNSDWDLAVRIRDYNVDMLRKGLRDKDYREDLILWVPWEWLNCLASDAKPPDHPENEPATRIFPIFGRDNEQVTVTDSRLKGIVFYVVAGHGGPDPGAIGKYKGHSLCEDEYAYDISLRLACNLIGHDATVYIIIQDPDDGIREGAVLKCDKDETCRENQKIPVSQMPRLKQRCDAVNSLYTEHRKKGNIRQYVLILHVDSRSTGQRIDMFFYHHEKSSEGKRIAGALRDMIREKYDIHQKSRGYSGTVSPRNLYMIRNTKPVAVYAELGNIRNSLDQRRFVIADNRQAVANWIAEGLLKALSK